MRRTHDNVVLSIESGPDKVAITNPQQQTIVESIIEFIRHRFPAAPDDLGRNSPLLDDGMMDSFGVLELMTFLASTYGIEISDEDFLPENLESVDSLVSFVERKKSSST